MKAKDLLVALFIGFIFSVLLRGQDLLPESPQAQGPELAWIQAWDGYLKAKQSGVDEEIKLAITNLKKLARGAYFHVQPAFYWSNKPTKICAVAVPQTHGQDFWPPFKSIPTFGPPTMA